MNNKKILATICAVCCAFPPISALAENVPPDDLGTQLVEAWVKGPAAVQKVCEQDYSDYVNKTDSITVTVDEDNQRKMNMATFGVQHSWGDDYAIFMSDNDLKPTFKEFVKTTGKIPVVRWGGADLNYVDYLNNIGPFETRKGTESAKIEGLPEVGEIKGYPAYKMGVPETLKMLYSNNPDMEMLFNVSLWLMPPEHLANFAHYLLDDKDESEWGAKRAADGIENPIKVWYWELANEVDAWGTERSTARMKVYTERAIAAVEAIRSVDPDAKIMANGPTAPWGTYIGIPEDSRLHWSSWYKGIMPTLVNYVDGISYHPYYDGISPELTLMFADKMKEDLDKYVAEQDIRDKDGNLKDMEVIVTEHNKWCTIGEPLNVTFSAATSTAQFYNLCMQREWLTGTMFHDLQSSPWCAFWYYSNDEFYLTPTAKMHAMYVENIGDRLCSADWVMTTGGEITYPNYPNYDKDEFSVLASPDGAHNLKIFLVNKTPYRDIDITFNFGHNYTLVADTVLKAPNAVTAPANRYCESLATVTRTEKNEPNFSQYKMHGMGVVVLELKTDDILPGTAADIEEGGTTDIEAPEAETLAFTDIENNYAKNEITALFDAGIIHGRTATEFAPDDVITRAELASLLSGVMGLKTDYRCTLWSDIPSGAWYEGFANALYIDGIMYGTEFRGNDTISVEDFMTLVGKLCMRIDNTEDYGEITGDAQRLTLDAAYAVNKGMFSKLLAQKDIDTKKPATRADVAAVLYKISRIVK